MSQDPKSFFGASDGDDSIVGTQGDDSIVAGAGNDTIDGRGGNDTIVGAGGLDNDIYLFGVGDGHDIITRGSTLAAEFNTLQFKAGVLPSDVTIAREWRSYIDDQGHQAAGYVDIRITLPSGDSVLIMDFSRDDDPFANGNPLQAIGFDNDTSWDLNAICAQAGQGTAGNDTLVGFDFLTETLRGFDGDDKLVGNAGDTLQGGNGNDDLQGDAKLLDGGDGDDFLQGNEGAQLTGGNGNDTLFGGKTQQGGADDDYLNADAATMDGGAGNDTLVGTPRSDMSGGAGADMLSVFELGTLAEHASLRGGTGNDQLQAGPYTEVYFDSGDGRDSYLGYYNVDGVYVAADRAVLHLGSGITQAGVHVSLQGDALVVGLGGSDAVSLTDYFADVGMVKRGPDATISIGILDFNSGPDVDVRSLIINGTNGANTLTGTAGDDVIAGYVGDDKLNGGDGNDGLHGGTGNDSLTGGNGNDMLVGYIGRDTLVGNAGTDTLMGGANDDTYVVDDALDVIIESVNGGFDLVKATVSWTLAAEVEKLWLQGSANLDGQGNELDNTLTGNSGVNWLKGLDGMDTLDGGAGADHLEGGNGDDTYLVDNALDVITEGADGGNDTVLAAFNWTLADQVENLQLTGAAKATGKGNALNNLLLGNDGVNTLQGLAGADTFDGGLGNDKLQGGKGGDTYRFYGGGAGKDTVIENDSTAGVRDAADFGGLLRSEVKFVHVGNNLEARIIGTLDKLIIKDWYLGAAYQVEDFIFADGTFTGDQVAPAMDVRDWLPMTPWQADHFETVQSDVWL